MKGGEGMSRRTRDVVDSGWWVVGGGEVVDVEWKKEGVSKERVGMQTVRGWLDWQLGDAAGAGASGVAEERGVVLYGM